MSSEMREYVAALRDREHRFHGMGGHYVAEVIRGELEGILARTEAGADGAEPFGWWIECHGTDGDFGQFVTDRAFVDLLRSHGVVERETALYTHPQYASGDAEVRELRRVLNKLADYWIAITRDKDVAHRDRAIIDAYDKGLTKCAAELRAAMQAKEAK